MSCATLKYLVDNTDHGCMNITISNSQNISGVIAFINSSDLSIIGTGLVNIICDVQGGMLFENTQRIHLENLKFISCAMNYSYSNVDMYPYIDHAAVYFYGGNDIEITGCIFTNGLGTGVIMYDVIGNNQLSYTNFTANRPAPNTSYDDISVNSTFGGLTIRRQHVPGESTYIIHNCIFDENIALYGGGIALYLESNDSSSFISVIKTLFTRNYGIQGGGVYVIQFGTNSSAVMNMINSSFEFNHANTTGGGFMMFSEDYSTCNFTHYMEGTIFKSNTAIFGGGLAYYYNQYSKGNIFFTAYDSTWQSNSAVTSGMCVGTHLNHTFTTVKPSNKTRFNLLAKFYNCWFVNNSNTNYYINSVGAVYISGSRVEFTQCHFIGNSGSGLYIRDSAYATFGGNNTFRNNFGLKGAAIYMGHSSVMSLQNGSLLALHGNQAILEGGAIFTEEKLNFREDNDAACIFESLQSFIQSNDTFTVVFSDNLAGNRIHSIFVGDPSNCCYTECNGSSDNNLLLNSKVFHYQPNINSQVTSTAISISLESKPQRNANNQLEVMLGEKFYILPKVTDVFGNSAYITGHLVLVSNYKQSFMPTQKLSLIGPSTISMDNFTKNNELYIIGNKDEIHCANLSLQFVYQHVQLGYRDESEEFDIKLVECKNGYLYNETSQQCECYPSDNFICPTRNNSYACIRYGYWYGIDDKNGSTLLSCPGQNCHYTDGNCPQSSECPDSPDFCLLGKSNDLCRKGRGGTLCSECRENHSFTFGALKCVPSTSCKAGNTALILVGIFIYWMFSIFLVLIILSLDLSVGSGFMYGIVYYFSVVILFLENSVTDPILQTAINTCVAITQLSPRVFGNIDVCFAESWNMNLHHLMFHYATPVFVVSAIFTIICLSRYCRCPKSLSLAQNSPIHAISILVLFSYTSLAYTSFQILKSITINGDVKVYVDPKFSYFHKQHIPYAIVAILCECLISLPTCLLLLLAPCLSQRVNFVKLRLKPIVDDFQACYHPNHRWFAGFYFLARQLMYLAYVIPHQWLPQSFSPLHIVNALILIVHSVFQPYKQKWLNILDTILLIDLFLLSFFKLDLKSTSDIAQKAIPYLLIMFPILYLFSIIAVLLFKRFKSFWFWLNCRKIPAKPFSTFTATTVGINSKDESVSKTSSNITFADSFYKDDGEREPLLSDMNCGQSPYSKANTLRWNPGFTTSSLRVTTMKRSPHILIKLPPTDCHCGHLCCCIYIIIYIYI